MKTHLMLIGLLATNFLSAQSFGGSSEKKILLKLMSQLTPSETLISRTKDHFLKQLL